MDPFAQTVISINDKYYHLDLSEEFDDKYVYEFVRLWYCGGLYFKDMQDCQKFIHEGTNSATETITVINKISK
jgi:hypothetical protein